VSLGPTARPLLRGYGPLACVVVAFVLMAVYVPTDAPQRVKVTTHDTSLAAGSTALAGSGGRQAGGAVSNNGGTGVGTGPAGSTGGGSSGGAHTTTTTTGGPPPHTKSCAGPQVAGDPYSPPCIAFKGNNGGATSRGVSSNTITVAYRETSDPGFQQTLAQIGGAQFSDTPADIQRTIEGLADYFNKNFQFYGRKIKFVFYSGQGSQTNELLGGGQQEAGDDALKVATSIKAFADMSAATEPYGDALSREKVVNFGEPYLSGQWFAQRAPYAWSVATDCSQVSDASADIAINQLEGKTAMFAGPALAPQKRKLAILAPDNPWYQQCVGQAEAKFKAAGDPVPENIPYQLDLATLSSQAASVIAKLKAQGITTVVCGCDPIFPVYLTQRAQEQNYYPEWSVIGVALTDEDIVGQLFNQSEWAHAAGVTYQGKTIPYQATLGYAAYRSVRHDEPAQAVNLIYSQMYMMALGIQLAGPDLTPGNFEKGMRSYPGGTGEFGTWGFPNGHFTPTLDGAEIYWNPNATSAYNGRKGAYIFSSKRYPTDSWPKGNFSHQPYKGAR
jgi:Periplasmic binding protein